MQSIGGGEIESPRGSMGSEARFGAGSDIDYVARDIGEDLKDALDEFQLDKDGLDKLDSDHHPESDVEVASLWVPTARRRR